MQRPNGSSADEWLLFLDEHKDALPYVAVQIATAIEGVRAEMIERLEEISAAYFEVVNQKKEPTVQDRMLQFFAFDHLPDHLKEVSRPFGATAEWIVQNLPANPERTVALRKLLEAKDCAVRARLWKDPEVEQQAPGAHG